MNTHNQGVVRRAQRLYSGFIGSLAITAFSALTSCALVACGGSDTGASKSSSSAPSSNASSSSISSSASSQADEGMTQLKTQGALWAKASGTPITLKGTNLGNWLVQEFWMMGQGLNGVTDQCTLEAALSANLGYGEKERLMKLFHDSWITERDWDQLQALGFNLVRLPILWSVIEDENHPKTLREDAWVYLDWAIAQAKARGIYVILDLHGAPVAKRPMTIQVAPARTSTGPAVKIRSAPNGSGSSWQHVTKMSRQ